MLLTPLTGSRPAAATWSNDEEERRKALLSYFMRGESYILWDNIPRGSQNLPPQALLPRLLCRSASRRGQDGYHCC
jgi:hypothetical protein